MTKPTERKIKTKTGTRAVNKLHNKFKYRVHKTQSKTSNYVKRVFVRYPSRVSHYAKNIF